MEAESKRKAKQKNIQCKSTITSVGHCKRCKLVGRIFQFGLCESCIKSDLIRLRKSLNYNLEGIR